MLNEIGECQMKLVHVKRFWCMLKYFCVSQNILVYVKQFWCMLKEFGVC